MKLQITNTPHPLEGVVIDAAVAGELLDVSSIAARLSGGALFAQKKGNIAYRIVAADVLGYMASQGKLIQHGEWIDDGRLEDGGPRFVLP